MKVLLAFATVAAIASSHGQRHQQDSQRLQQDNQRQNDDNQGQQDQKQGEGLLDGPDFHGLCKEFVPCQRAEKFFASPLRQDSGCPRASDLEPEFGFEESEDCTSDGDQIQVGFFNCFVNYYHNKIHFFSTGDLLSWMHKRSRNVLSRC